MLKRWLLLWAGFALMVGSLGAQTAQELKVYTLLASIAQLPKGAEGNASAAVPTVQAMAQCAMRQLEQLTQNFAEAPLGSAAMVHDFFTLCNQVPVQVINDVRSRHLRNMTDAITVFNERYGSSQALAATRDVMQRGLVLSLMQFNRNVLFCLTVAHDQVADVTDAITDTIFYRPLAFIAEHKALMATLVVAVVVGGVAYYYYRTPGGVGMSDKSALPGSGAVGLSAVAPATWSHDAPLAGITLIHGDITQQTFGTEQARAAIVNAANTACLGGGGIDGAIHAAAGAGLRQECEQLPQVATEVRCPVGEARLTGGHALAPLRIIHTVGPDTNVPAQNADRQFLLANAYRNSLLVAQQNGILYVAFPCISTAIFGYNREDAAHVALDTITIFLRDNPGVIREVRFVTYSDHDFNVYLQELYGRFGASKQNQITLRNGTPAAVHCFRFRPYAKRGG